MMKKGLILATIAIALAGCKDSQMAQWNAMGKHHLIKQFSGGCIVGEWESTGNVSNEKESDGWYFEDVQTGKLVEVSGTLQITVK